MDNKSPLSTALKPNVSAGDEAEQKYQEALSELMNRLDSRKNRLFDPTLLAMAQGFLTPGQTGSFGEALGQAAKNVGAAESQQQKEDIDLAQMRLQVAQGAREQASKLKGQEAFRSIVRGQPDVGGQPPIAGQPVAGAAPTGTAGATSGAAPRKITMEQALAFADAYPEQKDMAKLLVDAVKFGSDRFKPMQNGSIFDTVTERYLDIPIPGQTASEYYVPELGESRTLKMTPNQYSKYQEARAEGLGREWIADFISPTGGKKTATAEELPPPKSASEMEAEAAAKKESAVKAAASDQERTTSVLNSSKAAQQLMPIYDSMLIDIKSPGMDKVMGVLERGDIQSAIGSLAEDAIRIGQFNIGIPSIRKILSQGGVDQNVIDKASQIGMYMAMVQFNQRQGIGSGTSVSNFEQMMVNAMGPSFSDTVKSFDKKIRFLRETDQFKIDLAAAIKNNNTTFDKFEGTRQFQNMFSDYRKRLESIVSGTPAAAPQAGAARSNTRTFSGTAGPKTIWERQPDGSFKDTGKAAP